MLDNVVMSKGSVWVMRLEESLKNEIEQAAGAQGLTMTSFVTRAVRKAVAAARKKSVGTGRARVFGGVPSFFRAACAEARSGGRFGYDAAAWHLANALGAGLQPDDVNRNEWRSEMEKLHDRIDAGDNDGVWTWFRAHFPRCMALVPTRRRNQFISGVNRAAEELRF